MRRRSHVADVTFRFYLTCCSCYKLAFHQALESTGQQFFFSFSEIEDPIASDFFFGPPLYDTAFQVSTCSCLPF